MQQSGARWLAHEQQEIGAAATNEASVTRNDPTIDAAPVRWPLTDLMDDRSLIEWARICLDLGLILH